MSARLKLVWLVLLVLAAVIVALEYPSFLQSGNDDSGVESAATNSLLSAPVEQLSAIEIAHAGELHRFERAAGGAWFYHGTHSAAAADHAHATDAQLAGRIEQAFRGLGRARIERQFPLDRSSATNYGLTTPQTLLLVYRQGGVRPLTQYAIGDLAPDTHSRYVTVVGSNVVSTIPNYQIETLLALIARQPEASGVKSSDPS